MDEASGIVVRAATVDDAGNLGRLLDEFATEFDDPTVGPVDLGRRAVALIATDQAVFLLGSLDDADTPCGLVQLRFRLSVWSDRLDAYLEDLFVQPSSRRRGVGSALLLYAERYALERGAAYMEIAVYEGDRDAVALYLSHGFRHWEEADAALPLETRPRYLYFLKTLAS
ncbi:MAG: GNAT family N-acetyltransferase [Candidatus Nanopelagicales bacterium]